MCMNEHLPVTGCALGVAVPVEASRGSQVSRDCGWVLGIEPRNIWKRSLHCWATSPSPRQVWFCFLSCSMWSGQRIVSPIPLVPRPSCSQISRPPQKRLPLRWLPLLTRHIFLLHAVFSRLLFSFSQHALCNSFILWLFLILATMICLF